MRGLLLALVTRVLAAPAWQNQQDSELRGIFAHSNSQLKANPLLEKYWAERVNRDLCLNYKTGLYMRLHTGGN
jgi:hypothetical protein